MRNIFVIFLGYRQAEVNIGENAAIFVEFLPGGWYNPPMDKQIRFYVSRKNVLTWLMAFCMLASAVIRIVLACVRGAGGKDFLWGQVVLPAVACVLYGLICLMNGEERYYKTAIPVFMMALYLCFYTRTAMLQFNGWLFFLYCFLYFTLATIYALTVDGKIRHFWVLLFVYMVPLAARTADNWSRLRPQFVLESIWRLAPDSLFLLGLILGVFATWIQNDGRYHATWGDRPDGRRLRTLYPMAQISPYIMVTRNSADNSFADSVEISNAERYIRQKRRDGLTNFGITHVILAAYVRTVAKYPGLNRFLAGQKVYSRGDDIQICMTIKKEMNADSPDSVIKLHAKPTDTAADVYRRLDQLVEEVKNAPLNSDFDNTARALTLVPGVLLKFTVWLLRTLDYFGLLPKFLLEVSPFHGSMFITSMGSLGIPPIYHHLYDFGNLPVFCSFGCKRRATEVTPAGEVVQRKYVDLNFVLDERIVDGFYYAAVFKYMKRIMQHPEVLDQPPEAVNPDID